MERIVITGASRGIGRAIARRLAGPGHELLVHGRDTEALSRVVVEVVGRGGNARAVAGDLTLPTDVEALVQAAGPGPLTALINNAGTALVKPLAEITLEEWQHSLAVNVTAPFLLMRGLLPKLQDGSSIVNILSVAARHGFAGWSAYSTAKFALDGLSQSVREEVRGRGIRVISIYPSATDTSMWSSVPGEWPRERMLAAEQVAEAVAWALGQPSATLVESIVLGDLSGTI